MKAPDGVGLRPSAVRQNRWYVLSPAVDQRGGRGLERHETAISLSTQSVEIMITARRGDRSRHGYRRRHEETEVAGNR